MAIRSPFLGNGQYCWNGTLCPYTGRAISICFEPETVLFRGNLEGAGDKEIVIFIADLAPGAVGSKHFHPSPEFSPGLQFWGSI
jgi:hypothetical protein